MKRFGQMLVSIILLVALAVPAHAGPVTVTYTWSYPTTGSPAVSFDIDRSLDGGTTWASYATSTTNQCSVIVMDLTTVIIRVRGKDSLGRTGVWSLSSDAYTNDPGPPGACGKPARTP